jgi:methylated-DNA-[protein]-cysteine S-methyltransferase
MTRTPLDPTGLLADLAVAPPNHLYRDTVVSAGAADQVTSADSPLGPVWLSWSTRGVTAVAPLFTFETVEEFADHHRREVFVGSQLPSDLERAVMRGFETADTLGIPVDLTGLTAFQKSVLEVCAAIPAGQVRPYGWIAAAIGNPGAVQAVGTALGHNPIPLIVPCHRVVRSDGSIGHYAFGPERKQQLLVREGVILA